MDNFNFFAAFCFAILSGLMAWTGALPNNEMFIGGAVFFGLFSMLFAASGIANATKKQ